MYLILKRGEASRGSWHLISDGKIDKWKEDGSIESEDFVLYLDPGKGTYSVLIAEEEKKIALTKGRFSNGQFEAMVN